MGKRGYWRLVDDVDSRPDREPGIVKAQQIHNSWAMQGMMAADPPRWRTIDDGASVVDLLRGAGELWFDGRRLRVEAGDLFVAPRGVPHLYGPDRGTRWDEISFRIAGDLFEGWVRPGLLDPWSPVRGLLPVEDWQRRWHEALLPLVEPGVVQGPRHWSRLIAVIAQACASGSNADGGEDPWLRRAIEVIRAQPAQPQLDLEAVARELHVSTRTVRRRFTNAMGVTPHRYHSWCVMDRARVLLAEGCSLADTAGRLGFPNPHYLSRRFKQVMGQTPREYREDVTRR